MERTVGPRGRRRARSALVVVAVVAGSCVAVGPPAQAGHGNQTQGVYRLPYADGTDVLVSNDIHNHNDAYDFRAGIGATVVAAASGWIRGIVQHHGEAPNPGDGEDINGDPQDDSLEHACGNNDPADTVVGACSDYNNYVWIEHPNGEWTKYSHLGTGTVDDNGWSIGDWIDAGETIGLENDIGQASSSQQDDVCWSDDEDEDLPKCEASHVHFEVGVPFDPTDLTPFSDVGGFMWQEGLGDRIPPSFCDVPGNDVVDGETYVAASCDHEPPTAIAGGPYEVDEGSSISFDGSASSDPELLPLTYQWCLGFADECPEVVGLDDPSLAQPTYAGIDDGVSFIVLNVYDQVEALRSQSLTVVTVENVPPSVTIADDSLDEGLTATVSGTIVDPGVEDTHTVSIDWGDGSPPEPITPLDLSGGVAHQYGDNGVFEVTVTATDDDGGIGEDSAFVVVGNVAPTLTLDEGGAVSFPGGEYFVVEPGEGLAASAEGTDPGSDDLTFTWSSGDSTTYFNNGVDADPFPSPFGTFPFAASDQVVTAFAQPGVETLSVMLDDDDGGADAAAVAVVVTGAADSTQGSGWWKHQCAGAGSPQIDGETLSGYLDVVNAVSSVFSEVVSVATLGEAHEVLSPTTGDFRARATAALMVAWLQFASGAVAWDATVPFSGGNNVPFLELMADAEEVILDMGTTNAELLLVERDLDRVRHAHST